MKRWGLLAAVIALWGCSEMSPSPQVTSISPKPKDGELALPSGYQNWPKFLSNVQRPDAKQVRELFINPAGAKASPGQAFPNGTVMVMELHKVKMNGDTPETSLNGQLVKSELAKVFVMEKGEGWAQDVPDNLKNGNWVFAAYGPDGKALAEDFTKCRACHAPLVQKDFVHRYDEYFERRVMK